MLTYYQTTTNGKTNLNTLKTFQRTSSWGTKYITNPNSSMSILTFDLVISRDCILTDTKDVITKNIHSFVRISIVEHLTQLANTTPW